MKTRLLLMLLTGSLAAAEPKAPAPAPVSTNAAASSVEDTYQPVPQDKFDFRIEQDPVKGLEGELLSVSALHDLQVKVSRGSDITISISTRGKTINQIKKEIKQKLDADYYQNATVHLRLRYQNDRPGRVFFTGAVKSLSIPLYPNEQKTVLKAILEVGHDNFANLKKVRLHRLNRETGKTEITTIDVQAMLDGKDRSKDVILQDEDRIEVPDRFFLIQ
jgi:protein involved in polysaccharide export with SLBB domain